MVLDECDNTGNGWTEWRQHVLAELKRLNDNVEKLEARSVAHVLSTSIEISRLKVWAAAYGGMAGMVVTLIIKEVISRW